MEGNSVYLVWQTDCWLSHNSKTLVYLGNDYEDCCAQITKEFGLNMDDEEELLENAQVRRHDDGFFIEEQRINAFCI